MSRFSLRDLYRLKTEKNFNEFAAKTDLAPETIIKFDGVEWGTSVLVPPLDTLDLLKGTGLARNNDTVVYNKTSGEWQLGFNAPVKFYPDPESLPTMNIRNGTLAFVTDDAAGTKRLYVWKGTRDGVTNSGTWFEIMTTNAPVAITSRTVDGQSYESFNGLVFEVSPSTPVTVAFTAEDPEGLPIQWTFTNSNPSAFSVTNNEDGSFVITALLEQPLQSTITFKAIEVAESGQNITSEFATFVIDVSADIKLNPLLRSAFVYDPQIEWTNSSTATIEQGVYDIAISGDYVFVLNYLRGPQLIGSDAQELLDENNDPIGYPVVPRILALKNNGGVLVKAGEYPPIPNPESPDFEQEKTTANSIATDLQLAKTMDLVGNTLFLRGTEATGVYGTIVPISFVIDEQSETVSFSHNTNEIYSPATQTTALGATTSPRYNRGTAISSDGNRLYVTGGIARATAPRVDGSVHALDISDPSSISAIDVYNDGTQVYTAIATYELRDYTNAQGNPLSPIDLIYTVKMNNTTSTSESIGGRHVFNVTSGTLGAGSSPVIIENARINAMKVFVDTDANQAYLIAVGDATRVFVIDTDIAAKSSTNLLFLNDENSLIATIPNPVGVTNIFDIDIDVANKYAYIVGTNFFGSVDISDMHNISSQSITGEIIDYDPNVNPDIARGVKLFDPTTAIIALDGALDRVGVVR